MDPILVISIIALVLAAVLVVRALHERITVFEYQFALHYRDGQLVGELPTGRHWIRSGRDAVRWADRRAQPFFVPGQEVLSSDGVPVKVSLAVAYVIEDPVKALHEQLDLYNQLYQALQLALRHELAGRPIDDILSDRGAVGPALLEATAAQAAGLGLRFETLEVKDLMLPGAVKDLYAQVVRARKEGEAALERARGETAALRNLANAARLVEEKPALFQLRVLQSLAGSTGNTVIVNAGGVAGDAATGAAARASAIEVDADDEGPEGQPS